MEEKISVAQNNTEDRGEPVVMTDDDAFIEDYSPEVLGTFVVLGVLSVLSSSLACYAMHKTRKIPYSTRFLSRGLLVYDCLFITTATVRKFVQDAAYNVNLNVLGNIWIQLGYMSVAMMSIERLYLFLWPERYMSLFSKRLIRRISTFVWSCSAFCFVFVRYIVCSVANGNFELTLSKPGYCNNIISLYLMTISFLVLSVAFVCYWNILRLIKTKEVHANRQGTIGFASALSLMKSYRSTSLVLVFWLTILVSMVAYLAILALLHFKKLSIKGLRTSSESVTIINCLLDPYLYVFWFRESRMELLKMLAPLNIHWLKRAEKMRMEIFDIVVYKPKYKKNKVHPMLDTSSYI